MPTLYDSDTYDSGLYEGAIAPPPPAPPSSTPTAAQIADAITGRYGGAAWRLIAQWYSPEFELISDVSSAIIANRGSIQLDNTRAVMRTAQLSLLPENLPVGFDRLTDYLHLNVQLFEPITQSWCGYSNGGRPHDGCGYYSSAFPLGFFLLDDPTITFSENGHEVWDVQAADPIIRLVSTNVGEQYTIPAGTNYVTAIETVLDLLGLTIHEIPPTSKVTPIAFTWPWQTYWWTVLTNLTDGINYYPVWADAHGTVRTRERVDPSTETVTLSTSTLDEPKLILPPWVKATGSRFSTTGFTNRAVVKLTDPLRAPLAVEARNDDPNSPASTVSRGFTRTQELPLDHVADETTMYDIAKWVCWDNAARLLTGQLRTYPDPRRFEHETYRLEIDTVEAQTIWRVANFVLPLTFTDAMTHQLEQVLPVTLTTAEVVVA